MNPSLSMPSGLRVKGTPSASVCPAKRGFEVSERSSRPPLETGVNRALCRLTTTLGTTYIVEPIEYVDGLRDRCLSARFLDSRGYWDEGDFEVGQIVSLEPQLEVAA